MNEGIIIFNHIPKTAGTTMKDIIERQYPHNTILNPLASFLRNSSSTMEGRSRLLGQMVRDHPQKEKIRFISGHIQFGLHEYLPFPSAYVTVLRDPVDRVISQYYHIFSGTNVTHHKKVVTENMDLIEFLESYHPEMTNVQTRYISGKVDDSSGSITDLDIAKRNIQNYYIAVGISERFDETLILFKRLLGWKNVFYIKRNVSRNRPLKSEIPQETIETIEKYNKMDMKFYEFCKQRFEKLIQEQDCEQNNSFKDEVIKFQRLNNMYSPILKIYEKQKKEINRIKNKVIKQP